MAKQPLEENGIHRAKLWEIGFYALNNTSSNTYGLLVASISYYLIGVVGVVSVLAGSLVTIMRVWDGVSDPFVGMIVDKTNGKFGKNRPFIVAGQVIMFLSTFIMFRALPCVPSAFRLVLWILLYMFYIIGYTAQCVVTKSAQSCLTNDPKQRPIFAMFDSVYNILLYYLWYPIFLTDTLYPMFTLTTTTAAEKISAMVAQNPNLANVLTTAEDGTQTLSAFYNPEMWQYMQLVCAAISAVLACCAIIGLWRKDRPQYFGLGTNNTKVGFRDYVDVLTHNRAIQMLVASAASDKLTVSMKTNSTIYICLFGIVFGNYAAYSSNSAITSIPIAVLSVLGMNYVARYMGQKKALVMGTWGSIISSLVLGGWILIGVNSGWTFSMPTFSLTDLSTWAGAFVPSSWSMFAVIFMLLFVLVNGFSGVSSSIVIPMTADCADYEVYRSGRYVPGLMGTLFSFVDKLISSLASTLVAVVYAAIGFGVALPTVETPYSGAILWATLFCFIGAPLLGWLVNIVAMKFYPLSKEKMEEIQDEIARIKAEAGAQEA
ncbi:MAG: MFS transporter [Clostridiales bacterium]|nr:MFS transporter [Clostridiales bacterium]